MGKENFGDFTEIFVDNYTADCALAFAVSLQPSCRGKLFEIRFLCCVWFLFLVAVRFGSMLFCSGGVGIFGAFLSVLS
jgi:hypothetical protein